MTSVTYGKVNELVSVQSATGVGRSRYVQNLVYEERKKGLNCLVLSNELSSMQLHAMQVAKHMYETNPKTAIGDDTIIRKQHDLDQAGELYDAMLQMDKQGFGKFFAEYTTNLHLDNLEATLTAIWDDGYHFDVVAIDGISFENTHYTLEKFVDVIYQLAQNFKGGGFKPIVARQARRATGAMVQPQYIVNHTYIELTKVDDTHVNVSSTVVTANEVKTTSVVKEVNYPYCHFK